jgi:hypothetical protein
MGKSNKSGQVTIFIIIGILIIAVILLFLFLRNRTGPSGGGDDEEPQPESYLETCMKEEVFSAIDLISMQGGYRTPPTNSRGFQFTGEPGFTKIAYLCFNYNYYCPGSQMSCINQEPVLLSHLKNELAVEINGTVRNCWNKLGQSLETAGYTVEGLYQGFNLSFTQTKAIIAIKGQLTLTKNNETTRQTNIKVNIPTAYYKIGTLVQEIVNQESRYGKYNGGIMMFNFGTWLINVTSTSSLDKIYTIKHKKTEEKFRFLIRGCVPSFGL